MNDTLTKVRNINKTVKDYNKHKKNMLVESNYKHTSDKNLDKQCADNILIPSYRTLIDNIYRHEYINVNLECQDRIKECNTLVKLHLVNAKQNNKQSIKYYLTNLGSQLLDSIDDRSSNWKLYVETALASIGIPVCFIGLINLGVSMISTNIPLFILGLSMSIPGGVIGISMLVFALTYNYVSDKLTEHEYLSYMKHHLNHHDYMIVKKLFRSKEC